MCEACIEAVRRHFPNVPENEYGTLLMNATCFPFGTPKDVDKQLAEMAANGISTVDAACAYADTELHKAMAVEQARALEGKA